MTSTQGLAAVLGGAAAIGALAAWRAATASGSTHATITLQKIGSSVRGKRRYLPTAAATGGLQLRHFVSIPESRHGCRCPAGCTVWCRPIGLMSTAPWQA